MNNPNEHYHSSYYSGLNSPSVMIGIGVLISSFLVYVFTLAPTVIWGDSAAFALNVMKMRLGVGATDHPLYIILGRLFSYLPFEVAYSLNLLSAVSASLAVFFVYLVIFEITGSIVPSTIGAASLALSHAFWLHAVIAEVYDLNALFVVFIIFLLLKWRKNPLNHVFLYLAAFFFGLGLSNHFIMVLTVLGLTFFVLITDYRIFFRIKTVLITIISFLIGNTILIILFINKLLTGRTAAKVMLDSATGGSQKKAMFTLTVDIFKDVFMYLSYLFYQYPLAGFVLGFLGIFTLLIKDKKTAISLLLIICINMLFFTSFGPGTKRTTKYTFYISDYAVFSIFIGYGYFAFQNYLIEKGFSLNKVFLAGISLVILSPLLLYNITPYASKALGIDLLHARTIPYRDNDIFFLNPNKRGYDGAAKYAEESFNSATPNSIIIADYTPLKVLEYYQEVKGDRKDILIINNKSFRDKIPDNVVAKYYGKRDIYLADMGDGNYRLRDLKEDYHFKPEGVLYKIVKK